jgi:acetyl esterase/lipase
MPRTVAYGDRPEQVLDLHLPPGEGPVPVVVLVHGGCFRAVYGRDLDAALAADAAARGHAAVNVEYRRLGQGGGWPATLDDVCAALAIVPALDPRLQAGRIALVGHSAGGYLALLAATRAAPGSVRGVVAQAPVADLEAAVRLGVCAGAAEALLAAGAPSPIHAPPAVPQLVVHGDADEHVPVAIGRAYARAAGARYVELAGCGHMEHLDPAHAAWRTAAAWLDDLLEAR